MYSHLLLHIDSISYLFITFFIFMQLCIQHFPFMLNVFPDLLILNFPFMKWVTFINNSFAKCSLLTILCFNSLINLFTLVSMLHKSKYSVPLFMHPCTYLNVSIYLLFVNFNTSLYDKYNSSKQ